MQSMLNSALDYNELYGFSVIPCNKQKKPLIKWQEYQQSSPSTDQITEWWDKWPDANIGIVTGKISNLAVVDIDDAEGFEEIQKYIPGSIPCPKVESPRKGQHWYFSYPDCDLRLNARLIPGCDLRAEGGYIVAPPSIMPNGAYKWLADIKNTPLPKLPQNYIDRVLSSSVPNLSSEFVTSRQVSSKLFTPGRRDNDLFHIAHYLVKSGLPTDEVLQVLRILGEYCQFPSDEVEIKVKSAMERADKKDRNLSHEIREWVLSSSGVFVSSEVARSLHLSSRDDTKHLSKVLSRLTTENVIEKSGNKNGVFRRVEQEIEVIDWMNAPEEEYPLIMPLGIEEHVKIMPKNLIVVAGAPDSGKTAFLLNIVASNMNKYNIYYYSSEMSEQEMKLRLSKFNMPLSSWKFNAFDRSSNFEDVIRPDDLNIIDFLELHDEFWKVGETLKKIYSKLNKGIAIIAIQKKFGARFGKGGDVTMEKPRLYLSMEQGQIIIEKGKNWRVPTNNPNGLACRYKLIQGAAFKQDTPWAHIAR